MSLSRPPLDVPWTIAITALVLFGVTAFGIESGRVSTIDAVIRENVHAASSACLTFAAKSFSLIGAIAFLAVAVTILVLILWRLRRPKDIKRFILVMVGALILENGIKLAFHRPRPEVFFGAEPVTYSFPSGHALLSLCFYGMLAHLIARYFAGRFAHAAVWILAVLLITGIGWSRLYLGVHYPSDVFGGYLVAAFWLSVLHIARRGFEASL